MSSSAASAPKAEAAPGSAQAPPTVQPRAVALYDGDCPLCKREIAFLQRNFTRSSLVEWVDISEKEFDAAARFNAWKLPPKSVGNLTDEMHVYDAINGVMHTRVAAFRFLYATLGYPFLNFTKYRPFDRWFETLYDAFAANKHRVAWIFR